MMCLFLIHDEEHFLFFSDAVAVPLAITLYRYQYRNIIHCHSSTSISCSTSIAILLLQSGNHPLLKRVQSEPTYDQYTNSVSTLSFADRKQLQKRFRLVQGKNKLQKRILESRKSLTSVAMLAKDKAHTDKKGKAVFAPWHIPPLPHEEGLGEMLASKSIKHYKVHARFRNIDFKTPVRL